MGTLYQKGADYAMKAVNWEDDNGRRHRVLVPDDCPEDMYPAGIPVGPPDLAPLGLPPEIEVRLHNQLHSRGIFTPRDALRRPADLQGALQGALKLDIQALQRLYVEQQGG